LAVDCRKPGGGHRFRGLALQGLISLNDGEALWEWWLAALIQSLQFSGLNLSAGYRRTRASN